MKIDWISKLQHLLQTMAFCLAVATIQYAFTPERPYAPQIAYSLNIGIIIWATIDIGRHLFPSAAETGWPRGWQGLGLVLLGIVAGYLLGTNIADMLCRTFGWYAGAPPLDRNAELRTSILITAMAGIAGSYYFYSINKSRYLERKMGEARSHANEARLKLLETQLEPHMLFNTLANLRVLIGVDPVRAQEMLDHMIAYLRATLNASRAASHPLQAEFDRLRDYLELMAIRMGPRLQYSLELPPELAQLKVPALLLQPLVENSIQHGLEPKVEGGRITVTARTDGEQMVLEVADTGAGTELGFPAVTTSLRGASGGDSYGPAGMRVRRLAVTEGNPSSGFGLTQIRDRLLTMYGDAASLQFDSTPNAGTRAIIRIPLRP